jgi:hypothetical protein
MKISPQISIAFTLVVLVIIVLANQQRKNEYKNLNLHEYNNINANKLNRFDLPNDASDISYFCDEGGTQMNMYFISFNSKLIESEIINHFQSKLSINLELRNSSNMHEKLLNNCIKKCLNEKKRQVINSKEISCYTDPHMLVAIFISKNNSKIYLYFNEQGGLSF